MKIYLAFMVDSFSTFLLQMIEAISQVLEQNSSCVLNFHHYDDKSLLMYNFFIDSDQEDTFDYIVMQYCELLCVMKKLMLEWTNRWYVKPKSMLWFTNFLLDKNILLIYFLICFIAKKKAFTICVIC